MSKTGRYGVYITMLGFFLLVSFGTGWAAPEKQSQSRSNQESSAMGPEKLPEMLAAATANLENMIADLRKKQETEEQVLKNEIKPEEDLKGRIAALNASMAVNELDLAAAKEALQSLNSEGEGISSHLKELKQRQQDLDRDIQHQAEALTTLKNQVVKLSKTDHPVNRSENFLQVYQKYLRRAQDFDLVAKNYQKFLGKNVSSLQEQLDQLNDTSKKIEKEYLEKAFKQELLRRQSLKSRLEQIGQSLVTLAEIPGKTRAWFVGVFQSGTLMNFVEENLVNLIGLGLLLAAVGEGTHRLKKLMLPGLMDWQKHLSEVNLKGFLAFIQISAEHLFFLCFVVWLYVAFWRLEVISGKIAWLVWSLVAAIMGLRLALKLIQRFFSGEEAGGILPLSADLANYYRVHLKLLTSYFVLLHFFVIANAKELGFSPEVAGNLKTVFQAVLLGWVLWLLGSRRLEPVLTALPLPPFLKKRNFLRALRSAAFLSFAFMVIFGLLGFKFLFEYMAQGAAFTMIVLALTWILGEAAAAILRLLLHPEIGALARKYADYKQLFLKSYRVILQTVRIVLAALAVLLTLNVWGIPLERLNRIFEWLQKGPALGPIRLTPANIGLTISICYLGFWFSRLLGTFLEQKYFPRKNWDPGIQYTISRTVHYVILVITVLLAMNIMGITFTSLALVAGALGVGIGFGLQNIVSNFLSGLILLFERPVKVGDMLIIDGQWGMVKEIRVRSTIFQTFDRYFLIIPNSDLISGKILNWTYAGWGLNRLTLKVGVSYDSDPRKVTKIIENVCRANSRVVPEPPPQIFFEAYGDSSLNFNIWIHLPTPGDRIPATHELNSAIFEAFQNHGIEIPFPQRDLHVKTWVRGTFAAGLESEKYPESKTGSPRAVCDG